MDHKKALDWYQALSKQNMDQAHFYIGLMYERGDGVKKTLPRLKFGTERRNK